MPTLALVPSVTEDDVTTILRSFLLAILPDGVEVFLGQANRVPEPAVEDFVVMTPNSRRRLATTTQTWDQTSSDPTEVTWAESTQIDIQLDIHGAAGTDNAQVIQTLFRSDYACTFMASSGVQPLYCDDGQQVPFINGENQYENRWIINAQLTITPQVQTPQDFAATLTVPLVDQNQWGDLP